VHRFSDGSDPDQRVAGSPAYRLTSVESRLVCITYKEVRENLLKYYIKP